MAAEPAFAQAADLAALREAYGPILERLIFLPNGTAPAYPADGPSGRFFLKVLPPTLYA
ncbi:hypothetical protein [Deinococcus hopiensis]|uniref:Uncharacterized protein n=1 Tax=Deinococcus hopiensis KR-140 TaxID=695939 RepID=A0A1W1V925_9DEIO|nr:hypothetical protein [Deinococcus hopiensis]SMB89710.1 hypothetical protein SAMN00790413_00520 [Deinococcus hopiensis KR-140]